MNDAIELTRGHRKNIRKEEYKYSVFPAVKIGKFAIDMRFQGRGIGSRLMELITERIKERTSYVGCRFITVDAKNDERAISFWLKNKFIKSKANKEGKLQMHYDLKHLEL